MTKEFIKEKIQSGNFDNNKLLKWIDCLPTARCNKPTKIKKGDVFMHPVFRHPYVFLKKNEDAWVCTILTHNGDFEQVLEQCNSRFFHDSYISKVLFTIGEPVGSFMGVYDNTKQLNSAYNKLIKFML